MATKGNNRNRNKGTRARVGTPEWIAWTIAGAAIGSGVGYIVRSLTMDRGTGGNNIWGHDDECPAELKQAGLPCPNYDERPVPIHGEPDFHERDTGSIQGTVDWITIAECAAIGTALGFAAWFVLRRRGNEGVYA